MDNFRQQQQLRDNVHREIIRTVINTGKDLKEKYLVLVNSPVQYFLERDGRPGELINIAGIDGHHCELIDTEANYLRYQDVPIEQLTVLLNQLKTQTFKIKQ
jgi:hypothetical protein